MPYSKFIPYKKTNFISGNHLVRTLSMLGFKSFFLRLGPPVSFETVLEANICLALVPQCGGAEQSPTPPHPTPNTPTPRPLPRAQKFIISISYLQQRVSLVEND